MAGDVVPAAIGTGRELRLPDIAPPESIARSSNYTQPGASLRAWTAAVKRFEGRSKYYIESARSLCDSLVRRLREELAAMRPAPCTPDLADACEERSIQPGTTMIHTMPLSSRTTARVAAQTAHPLNVYPPR